MRPWLVHVLLTAGTALPVLAAALLLALNSAGAFTFGTVTGVTPRMPATAQTDTPAPNAANVSVPVSTPTPEGAALDLATAAASASATPTATPTETPTAEPTDWIRTAVYVTVTAASVVAGQSITVTPELIITGTCGFPIYDITLNQDPLLFAYSDPMDKVVRGGSASWRLTAFAAGTTTFRADYYGETYCDGVWQWHYARGQSEPLTVTGEVFGLPYVNPGP